MTADLTTQDQRGQAIAWMRGRISEADLTDLQANPERLAPRWAEVTILCVDLRGFRTARRHFKEPARVFEALDRHYFSPVIALLLAHGGYVDRIVDDQIHAIFGAPVSKTPEAAAKQAVSAAHQIHEALQGMSDALGEAIGVRVKGVACGLASGKAMCGLIGAPPYRGWTLLGELTTLAAAIEDAAAEAQILADGVTLKRAGEGPPPEVEQQVVVVGRATPADVYLLSER